MFARMLLKYKAIFTVPSIREKFVRARIFYLVKVKKSLQTQDSKEAFEVTVKHNLKSLKMCNNRMDLLIKPVSVIESIGKQSKVLVIGPRNENDLFSLLGHGFAWHNIFGLDLITYSNKILLGDMHNMPFDDNYFDVILCGWTISYSSTPQKAADEMYRVIKNNGVIGIGVEYSTLKKEDSENLCGYSIQNFDLLSERINSTKAITQLFEDEIKDIYFLHDAPNKISHTKDGFSGNVSNVAAIFSVRK